MFFGKERDIHRTIVIFLVLLSLGVLSYSTRFFMNGIPHYHNEDTIFHINRLLGLGNVWDSPVNYYSFCGNGTYVNLFYPWLTMYPMWILYKISHSYVLAYKLYYLLLGIATIFISYRCMMGIVHDDLSSICFAALYTFSSYRFANVYIRAALGESVAMTFLPLVLLGIYNIFFDDEKKWRTMSIGFALIAYTHNLSLLLVGFITVTLGVASFYFWDCKKQRVICFVKAVFVAIMLSLAALIPMLHATMTNNIFTPEVDIGRLIRTTDKLSDIINNSISNTLTQHSIGLLVLFALIGFIILIKNDKIKKTKEYIPACVFAVFGLVILFSASSLFPWGLIGRFSLFRIIQFPWRLYAYSTLLITAAFSIALKYAKNRIKLLVTIFVCLFGVALMISSVSVLHNMGSETTRITDETIESYKVNGDDRKDYSPETAKNYRDQNGYTLNNYYLDGNKVIPESSISENGTSLFVNIKCDKKNQIIDIPVYWFTSLQAKVNGEKTASRMSERGTVLLTLSETGKNTVEIFHTYDKWTYISWTISFVVLIVIIITKYIKRPIFRKGNCQI